MRKATVITTFFAVFILGLWGPSSSAADLPFWRAKADLKKKMEEDRAVFVSVRREDLENGQLRFSIKGAGIVNRPIATCFQVAQDYPRLKEVSDNFKVVNLDRGAQELFLITEALGYQARMILKLSPSYSEPISKIKWWISWGVLQGMRGELAFEKLNEHRTEISIHGVYEAAEFPLPRIFMGFALEVVTQKVAQKMREFIERVPEPYITEAEKKAGDKKVLAEAIEPPSSMVLTSKGDLLFASTATGRIFVLPQVEARAKLDRKFFGEAMPLGEVDKLKEIYQCNGKVYARSGEKSGHELTELDKKVSAALEGFEKMPRWTETSKIPVCPAVQQVRLFRTMELKGDAGSSLIYRYELK